jgi:hypothetical protein
VNAPESCQGIPGLGYARFVKPLSSTRCLPVRVAGPVASN